MKKGIKIAILALSFILVIGVTAVSVWALSRTDVSSKFKIHFIGKHDVEATINASSHYIGYTDYEYSNIEDQPAVEIMDTVVFDKNTTTATKSMTFEKDIDVFHYYDKIFYRFKITNNSSRTSYSDIIIKPTVSLEDEDTALISGLYYNFGGSREDWVAVEDGFITLHKDQTVYVELQFVLVGSINLDSFEGDSSLSGKVEMELYSELDLPADYVQEYEYLSYNTTDSTLTRRKVCHQCDHEYTEIETCVFGNKNFLLVTPSNVAEVQDFFNDYKTVVFTPGDYSDITIDVTPSNVTKIYDMANISENTPVWTNANGSFAENPYAFVSGKTYLYETELKDVTFVAMDGANFKQFTIDSLAYYDYTGDNIRGTNYSFNASLNMTYAKRVVINGLTFDGFNFQGFSGSSVAGIKIGGSNRFNVNVQDITIKNSSFDTKTDMVKNEGLFNSLTAIKLGNYAKDDNIDIQNLKIINNNFKNQNQAIRIQKSRNVLIANNVFESVANRCVDVFNLEGDIVLKNNNVYDQDVSRVFLNINGITTHVIIDNCKLNENPIYADASYKTLNIYATNHLVLEVIDKPASIFDTFRHVGKYLSQTGRG